MTDARGKSVVRTETALRTVGWRVTDPGAREVKPGGEAVRSAMTPGSYSLYVGRDLVGIVLSGPVGCDLDGLIQQARQHATSLTERQRQVAWRTPLPFVYATDGDRWWFRNDLDSEPDNNTSVGGARPRKVFAVHQPATVSRWLREATAHPDAPTLRARLRRLRSQPFGQQKLRPNQHRAIRGLEKSLAQDLPRALIQMATGAGKTFTVVASSERLLQHAKAHRILFLVDRNTLGTQAVAEYDKFRLPDSGRAFKEGYPVLHLTGGQITGSAKVVVTTIQRLWSMLSGQPVPEVSDADDAEDAYQENQPPPEVVYNPQLPPDAFDFIVVDECHRSIYGRWRPVLEYFDAHVVGLTATPVLQTFGYFNENLVSEYTTAAAIADKVNVDYDVYRITTRISAEGSLIPGRSTTVQPDGTVEQVNNVISVIDRPTRRERYRMLEKDDPYTEKELNRRVQSLDQIRTILTTFRDRLFTEIFPPDIDLETGEIQQREVVPKTLIFAQDNIHADRIVQAVREIFNRRDDFCAKITSQVSRAEDLVQAFRSQPQLRIAVTVDMIATGTDVPALECLLFLRDVKTWSYFEQMKGRGSRSIKPENLRKITPDAKAKDRFVIVDAVGVTQSDKIDARPLVRDQANRLASLERLLGALGRGEPLSVDDTATLAGRLSRLGQRLSERDLAEIEAQAGGIELEKLVGQIVEAVDEDQLREVRAQIEGDGGTPEDAEAAVRQRLAEAISPLAAGSPLYELVLRLARRSEILVDHLSQDQLLEARGISREELAEHVIRSWKDFLIEHREEITPLRLAFAEGISPSEAYTRLKDLADRLSVPPHRWTPERVWEAYLALEEARAMNSRRAGVPELLALLRYEWGMDDELRPYRVTVEERFEAWLVRQAQAGVAFTPAQRKWLDLIVDTVANSVTVSFASLDKGARWKNGGSVRFIEDFGRDRAAALLNELDKELGA